MSLSLAAAVAVGAGLATLSIVAAAAWVIGRIFFRGGAGVLVAALVVVLAGVLWQWEFLSQKDVKSLFSFLGFRSLGELSDHLFNDLEQQLGLSIRWREISGPLFNALLVPRLAVTGAVAGAFFAWLLNTYVPGFDRDIAAPWLRGSVAGIYQRLFLTIAAIGILLAFLPTTFWPQLPWANDAVRTAPFVLWAGPALAFAILWYGCVPLPARPSTQQREAEEFGETAAPDLAGLFESYEADFSAHLLLSRRASVPPAEMEGRGSADADRAGAAHEAGPTVDRILKIARSKSIDPGEAWGDELAVQLHGVWGDPGIASTEATAAFVLVHEAAPTALTFLVLAELALSAQDRGMSTLVVADEGSVARIGAEITSALEAFAAQETHRVYTGYGQPSGYYDVVVSSVQQLETKVLSSRDPSLADAVLRIGLVVVMDLTRIDSALLRLRFVHLSSLVSDRRPLVLVQSEPRIGLDAQIKSLIAPLGSYQARQLPGFDHDADRQWLMVWRNDTAFLESLFSKDLSRGALPPKTLEITPFLPVRAWRLKFGAAFYDAAGRVDRELWNETLPELAKLERPILRPVELAGVSTGRLPYPSTEDDVLVVEDLANLAEAVKQVANFRQIDEYLLHILSHDYPLREFLAARLAPAIEAGDSASLEAYLPIAPDAEGGPAALALAIATAVLEKGRRERGHFAVSEGELLDQIGMFRAESLTADFSGVTRAGLAELLSTELGCRPAIVAHRLPGHERHFVFNNVVGLRLDPGYLIALDRDTSKDQSDAWLDRGDMGLTYERSMDIQQFGEYFTVDGITKDKVVAKTAAGLSTRIGATQLARNRPRHRFARLYDVDMEPADLAVIDVNSTAGAALRMLARGRVDRTSVAYLAYPELEAPLARGSAAWKTCSRAVAMPRAMRIHARFTLPAATAASGELPRIALTLAATLQDVLVSIFPPNGERLAVMSPQAGAAIASLPKEQDPIERFPYFWLPRLIAPPTAFLQSRNPSEPPVEQRLFTSSVSKLIEASRVDQHGDRTLDDVTVQHFTTGDDFLDLVLIEDASHDLGCLRALFKQASWNHVADVWRDYLEWCVTAKDDERFYYRYGAARVPKIFDFIGARDFLNPAGAQRHGGEG